jgi:transposase InsO family protein
MRSIPSGGFSPKAHGIRISVSWKPNPWDNPACESFIKPLKSEEVYRSEYLHIAEAQGTTPKGEDVERHTWMV